jgi:sensor histidine kinase YesM
MAVCILVGSTLGYTLGTAVGDAITGFSTPGLLQNRTAIVISLIAAVAATWYFIGNEKLNLARAAAETARREAAESQLMLLQSQLEPHMLFNTLANLRVLITLDPPRAQAMLDRLIGYLRATLGASRIGLHPLADEFDRLADYLALMALRMGPRLQVALDLPTDLRALPVPPLLLQPLVENCIRHGLEPKVEGGRIEVRAARRGDQLLLTVRDTGVGLDQTGDGLQRDRDPDAPAGTSSASATPAQSHYGTQHVAARLATLYGARALFRLLPADDAEGGTLAEVSLPWPASASQQAATPAARPAPSDPAR